MPATSPSDPNVWARQRVDRMLAGRDAEPSILVAVMIASMDGSAAVDGKSGGLSSAQDRALVRAWRRASDVLLVGGRTLEVETYASILPEEDRAVREARGQAPVPLIATLSRRLTIDFDRVLSAQESLGVVVYTEVEPPATPPGPNVTFVRLPSADPASVVADIAERFRPALVVSEGGPMLLSRLLDAGQVTDLSLTLAPLMVAGSEPVIDHGGLTHPLAFTIADSEQVGDFLFPHYRLAGG